MPRVTVELTDAALKKLRRAIYVRGMISETWGLPEELAALVVTSLDGGEEVVRISSREEAQAEAAGKTDSDRPKA